MPTLKLPLTLLFLTSSIFSMPISDFKSAYEALESYDFPKGLLPQGVQSFLLQNDGRFDVFFGGTCEFKVEEGAYLLRYKRRISGRLVDGAVKDLKGVSVKALFVWVGIDRVVRTDDRLRFYSGLVSASFPISSFDDCPVCRGFDRVGGEIDEELVSFA